MPNARGKNKGRNKRRAKKVSKGIHGGGGRVKLTDVQKILLGGGAIASLAAARRKDRHR